MITRVVRRHCVPASVSFKARGFALSPLATVTHLETCADAFVSGTQLTLRHPHDPHAALKTLPLEWRGFAYEGAGFAAAALSVEGRGHVLNTLLSGPGWGYRHLVHVGVGWTMQALRMASPRPWRLDPVLRWLALNGYGFSSYFFAAGDRRAKLIASLRNSARDRIIAQGIGRALWWEAAADPQFVISRTTTAAPGLRRELLCGAALAAVYAGSGSGPSGTGAALLHAADPAQRATVAAGAVFGAVARHSHGLDEPTTTARLAEFAPSLTAPSADRLATACVDDLVTHNAPAEAYLTWQARIAHQLQEELCVD